MIVLLQWEKKKKIESNLTVLKAFILPDRTIHWAGVALV